MSSWFEERRADKAADAQQRREDREFESRLRREERREARKDEREEKTQKRRERAQRRQARVARREKALTPGNVYRKGTLALVAASALASLPAQIIHFVKIYWMLFPIGPAVEGAAWVMAAGVAYADEKKLPVWVRWVLRVLSLAAAGFAANINYEYGLSLASAGVSPGNAHVAGVGLAAVTLGGPLFFEVRQWVLTLTAAVADPKKRAEAKARAKHEKQRRKDHKAVVKLARNLRSAAPYGTLSFEDAFAAAWEIKYGTRLPGMTPDLHAEQLRSRKALADAMDAANGSPVSTRGRLLELLHPAPVSLLSEPGSSQVESQMPPSRETLSKARPKPIRKPGEDGRKNNGGTPPRRRPGTVTYHPLAGVAAADTARKHAVVNGHHH